MRSMAWKSMAWKSMAWLCCCAALCVVAIAEAVPSGRRTVSLLDADGRRTVVADIDISEPAADGVSTYVIEWRKQSFTDHFLSMRPFKCLEGPTKHWCRVPYPYEIKREIRDGDLTDIEYDLLFLWKGAGEYGINMWNGVYYRLERDGDRLIGRIHEMDMDKLGAPPAAGELRPIREVDLEEGDVDSHWLPTVVIE